MDTFSRLALVVGFCLACGGSQAEPMEPDESESELESGSESEPTPQPEPEPEPVASGDCVADLQHCCMDDGRIVRPGGCQPSYPDGVAPGWIRDTDGRCVRDPSPCNVRCLPASAMIATPAGDVAVSALSVGDVIFTRDGEGARVPAPVVEVGAVPLSSPHVLVEARLSDGRRVRASGGHPLADGEALESRVVGDRLDGAEIIELRDVAYAESHTYDVRPGGSSGAYWADGVLLGSTL